WPRLRPQPGQVASILVAFYGQEKDNKLSPTGARRSYVGLAASDEWTDPPAEFLGASDVRPKAAAPSADGRKYGGFIGRVYFDGQLQDARASAPELLTSFPAPDRLAPSPRGSPSNSYTVLRSCDRHPNCDRKG